MIIIHTVFCLVGESSSGKDSIANLLEKKGYKILKSYTTRPKRKEEKETHIFITDEEVNQYKDDIIAYTRIGNYQYFATKQQLFDSDIYIIDPYGLRSLKNNNKDIRFITIYIYVKEYERRQRARQRGDVEEEINKRFINEYDRFAEFKQKFEYDYAISNYNLNKSIQIIKKIIDVELERN